MPDIKKLQLSLGTVFQDNVLLEQALVHSSYINENAGFRLGHNERLEFLGDAVLDLVMAGRIYREYPDVDEGEMTRLRAALVRRDTLAAVARKIELGEFLCMGKGEEASGGRNKAPNLAGALEAVIAAVYLDGGFKAAEKTIDKLYVDEWGKMTVRGAAGDFKSRLQEFVQSRYQAAPVYRLVSETGPDHDKKFIVDVLVNLKIAGTGSGKSKKLAETEAARLALQHLSGDFTK
jgi:ribonuclease III